MSKKRKRPSKGRSSSSSKNHTQSILIHPVISLYYPKVLTLRQYLLCRLPASSISRRQRIQLLCPNVQQEPSLQYDTHALSHLFDSTLVGLFNESSPTINQSRMIEFVTFSQSQDRRSSLPATDRGPTCAQSEVGSPKTFTE